MLPASASFSPIPRLILSPCSEAAPPEQGLFPQTRHISGQGPCFLHQTRSSPRLGLFLLSEGHWVRPLFTSLDWKLPQTGASLTAKIPLHSDWVVLQDRIGRGGESHKPPQEWGGGLGTEKSGLASVPSRPAALALHGCGVLASFDLLPSLPYSPRPQATQHSSPLTSQRLSLRQGGMMP